MDQNQNQNQNQGTPLTSLMRWDRDGELCSEDLERLLVRLQAQDGSQQTHDPTSATKRQDVGTPRSRTAEGRKKARELSNQLAPRSSTT